MELDNTHIATNGELGGDEITIGLETEESEKKGEIVADVVDVLLCVDEFVECGDTITGHYIIVS